jgi:hypothetical protein
VLQSLRPSEMKSLDFDEAESFTKPADRLRVGLKSNVPLSRAQLTPPGGARALRFRSAWVSAYPLWVKSGHVQ